MAVGGMIPSLSRLCDPVCMEGHVGPPGNYRISYTTVQRDASATLTEPVMVRGQRAHARTHTSTPGW